MIKNEYIGIYTNRSTQCASSKRCIPKGRRLVSRAEVKNNNSFVPAPFHPDFDICDSASEGMLSEVLLSDWLQDYKDGRSRYTSFDIYAEIKLKEVEAITELSTLIFVCFPCVIVAHTSCIVKSPNRLVTAVCCDLLQQLAVSQNNHVMKLLLRNLYSAIYSTKTVS